MNDRELLALVAQTDPYPTGRSLPAGWETDQAAASQFDAPRSTSMSTLERPRQIHPNTTPPPGGRRWRAAIAAAVVVIAAIAVTLLVRDRTEQEVIDEPTTTTIQPALSTDSLQTARGIAEAFFSLDGQALLEAIGNPNAATSAVLTDQENAAALNTVLSSGADVTCQPAGADAVTCAAATINDLKAALNIGVGVDVVRVSFADGEVTDVRLVVGSRIQAFTDWVDANDPDRAISNCGESPTAGELATCWENLIALIPAYYNQTDVGGTSFVNTSVADRLLDAWFAGDGDEVQGLTSDIFNSSLMTELEQAGLLNTTPVRRDACAEAGTNLVECVVVVEDDFLREFGGERTDTLRVFFVEQVGYIVDVRWESVEQEQVEGFWTWLAENRPEIDDGPCFVSRGSFPDDLAGCWEARIAAVPDYLAGG